MKTCANCGMINYDDSSFCCGCGKPMAAAQPAVPPTAQPPEQVSAPAAGQPPFPSQVTAQDQTLWQSAQRPQYQPPAQSQVPSQVPYNTNPVNPPYPGNPTNPPYIQNPPYQGNPQTPHYAANPSYQGNPVNPPYMSSPANPSNPPYSPYTYGSNQYDTKPTDILQSVKEIGSSGLMLTLVIVWFVNCIASVVTSLTSSSSMDKIFASVNLAYLDNYINMGTKISAFISAVPSILIGIGLLMTYLSAKNTNNSPLSMAPSGLRLIRIITIIEMAFSCIAIVFCLVISIALMADAEGIVNILNTYFNGLENADQYVPIIGAVLLVTAILVGAVMIAFSIIYLKFIGSVIETIRTGTFHAKCATAVYVLAFITGGFAALSIFSSLTTLAVSPSLGIATFCSTAAEAATYIILGILVTNYKKLSSIYY